MLMHESGEWIAGTITMQASKDNPQAVGSALTYARRYSLMAIVGIASEDDDGTSASMAAGTQQTQAPAQLDEKIVAAINACADVEQLGALWKSMTAELRANHVEAKDKRKAELAVAQ